MAKIHSLLTYPAFVQYRKLVKNGDIVGKVLENINCYILVLMAIKLKKHLFDLERKYLKSLGRIRNNVKNIGYQILNDLKW